MPPTRSAVLVVAALTLGACSGGGSEAASASSSTTATAPSSTTTAPRTTSTTTTLPPTTTTTAPPAPLTLHPGDERGEVLELQLRLVNLGYWLGEADGRYGALTEQAVLAFQKAEGLPRDGIAGPSTLDALAIASRPAARDVTVDGIEIDLERQLLLVVTAGEVTWALNTSTGRRGWSTPAGTYSIEREINGLRHAPLGDLYRPKYFRGGIAVHGSSSIPPNPASHGCARVSRSAMDMLWSSGFAALGTQVRVY